MRTITNNEYPGVKKFLSSNREIFVVYRRGDTHGTRSFVMKYFAQDETTRSTTRQEVSGRLEYLTRLATNSTSPENVDFILEELMNLTSSNTSLTSDNVKTILNLVVSDLSTSILPGDTKSNK